MTELRTLAELCERGGEPVPDKPPVLIAIGKGRNAEWWRAWEPAPVKEASTCRYRLIHKDGRDVR